MCTATGDQTAQRNFLREQRFGLSQNLGPTMDSATRWRDYHTPPGPCSIFPLVGNNKNSDCKSQKPLAVIFLWRLYINRLYQPILCPSMYQAESLYLYNINMLQYCHAHSSVIPYDFILLFFLATKIAQVHNLHPASSAPNLATALKFRTD